MNPNEPDIELQLRELFPAAASPSLEQRIAADLVQRQRTPAAGLLARDPAPRGVIPAWLRGLAWACAGAVVALAAVTLSDRLESPDLAASTAGTAPVEPAAVSFEHAGSSEELVGAHDEGVFIGGDDEPVRELHYYTLERHVWINPHTGARMEVEIPREDVRFTPVAMQ